ALARHDALPILTWGGGIGNGTLSRRDAVVWLREYPDCDIECVRGPAAASADGRSSAPSCGAVPGQASDRSFAKGDRGAGTATRRCSDRPSREALARYR